MDTDSVSSCVTVVGKEITINCEISVMLRSKHCLTELNPCSHLSVSKIVFISSSSVGAAVKVFVTLPVYFGHRMDETTNPGFFHNDFWVLFNLLTFLESCWVQHFSYMLWLTFTEMIPGVTFLWWEMFLKPVSFVILIKHNFLSSVLYLAFVSAHCSPILCRADDQ